MEPKTLITIIGVIILIVLWFIFRGLIKEGSIQTNTPWLFMLSGDYNNE